MGLYLRFLLLFMGSNSLAWELGDDTEGVCTVLGGNHFTTFDGVQHDFQGLCEYKLASDCSTGRFQVFTKHMPLYEGAEISNTFAVAVLVEGTSIIIDRDGVTVNNQKTEVPKTEDHYSITIDGAMVTVDTTVGLRVQFDMLRSVRVIVSGEYMGKTCGLCGKWNCDKTDEISMSFNYLQVEKENSVRYLGCIDPPKPPTCEGQSRVDAQKTCEEALKQHTCKDVDYNKNMEACIVDICTCGQECLSDYVQAYKQACDYAATGIEDPCIPGTTAECRAVGDPHYNTFDGYKHDFQGMCEYVYAADCDTETWSVITKNEPWYPGSKVSTVARVTVKVGNATVVIDKKRVMMNNEVVTLPVSGRDDYKIEKVGKMVELVVRSGVVVTYDQKTSLSVVVTKRWKDKTCGLCGVWNNDITDESNMDYQKMHEENLYGNECEDTSPPPPAPQCPDAVAQKEAEITCNKRFEEFDCGINFDDRIDQCAQDVCACGEACLCEQIRSYVEACYFITRDEWYNVDPCGPEPVEMIGKCTTYGAQHYHTFDGTYYKFQGNGWYVLTKDCKDSSWEVQIQNVSPVIESGVTMVASVRVIIDGTVIEMNKQTTAAKVNGDEVSLPYEGPTYIILTNGESRLVLTTTVSVTYEGSMVTVLVKEGWIGSTCGLCGNWNQQINEEIEFEVPEAANENAVEGQTSSVTKPKKCSQRSTYIATFKCQALRRLTAYCPTDHIERFIEECISDLCVCGEACLCDIYQAAVKDCLPFAPEHDLPSIWRRESQVCRGGEVAQCTAWGDPHYTTFDGVRHHFQGMCMYMFAADCRGDQWKVITRNEASFSGAPVSAVAEVDFIFEDNLITIARDRVTVNGEFLQEPTYSKDFTIFFQGHVIEVFTNLGVTVSYDMRSHVKVTVDDRWLGTTCGLCGTWDHDTVDEIAMSADHKAMQEYLGLDKCVAPQVIPECTPEMKMKATEKCQNAYNDIKCDEVDPNDAIEDCIMDECACGEGCFCPNLNAYRQECYSKSRDPFYLGDVCAEEPLPPPEFGVCTTYEGRVFKTFDGLDYTFEGTCWYVLAKDCQEDAWKVEIEILPPENEDGVVLGNVRVTVRDTKMEIDRETQGLTVDGEIVSLPYGGIDFVAGEQGGALVVVALEDTLAVTYMGSLVNVMSKHRWIDSTCGLCGNWDQNIKDEQNLSKMSVASKFAVEGATCQQRKQETLLQTQ